VEIHHTIIPVDGRESEHRKYLRILRSRTQFTDSSEVMAVIYEYWDSYAHLLQEQNLLKASVLQYLLVMMFRSSEVFCGCNILLNATRGTTAASFSEVLSRKSTPGVETLNVLKEDVLYWKGMDLLFMVLWCFSSDIYIILLDAWWSYPHNFLPPFFLFILPLLTLVIITF
jgi:hypothetical protein